MDIYSTRAVLRSQAPLTVGLVGGKAHFRFSDQWKNLTRTVVFRQGDVTVDVVGVTDDTVIPWEVLQVAGLPVSIGVYGSNAEGSLVIPTMWVETDPVVEGADPSGDPSTDATLPVFQQIQAQVDQNKTLVVKITKDDEQGRYWASETLTQIISAHHAGRPTVATYEDHVMPLMFINAGLARFCSVSSGATYYATVARNAETTFSIWEGADSATVDELAGVTADHTSRIQGHTEMINSLRAADLKHDERLDGHDTKLTDFGDWLHELDDQSNENTAAISQLQDSDKALQNLIQTLDEKETGEVNRLENLIQNVDEQLTERLDALEASGGGSSGSGTPGADGVSCTHEWNGTVLTVTSASGTSSADLKGDPGAQGIQGEPGIPGYTPVKGVDYYTGEDKAELQALIADEMAQRAQLKPEFANSIDECTDTTKLYVLPDGYIYAYMTTTTPAAQYINILDKAPLHLNQRYSSSGGAYKAADGYVCTDFLPLTTGDVVRINLPMSAHQGDSSMIMYKDPAGTMILSGSKTTDTTPITQENDGAVTSFTVGTTYTGILNVGYVYIGLYLSSVAVTEADVSNIVITVNEEIKEGSVTTARWANTGKVFVAADYEGRIAELETKAAEHTANLSTLDDRVSSLEAGTDETETTAKVPDYWKDSVDAAITKVKGFQDQGGKDVVNFILFSDVHYGGSKAHIGNIGTISAAIMDACDIPLAIMAGDTLTAGVLSDEDKLLELLEGAWDLYAPIGADRLMLISGNHEDVYGAYTSEDGTTAHYVNKADPKRVWNKLYRPQSGDFRRVFGGNGTYYWLDNVPQKVRFICLNSSFYDGDGVTEGTENAMSFGFGAEQLNWLEHTALSVEEGWSVVVALHVPPTAYYASSFMGDHYTEIRRIITEASDKIIAVFTGHMHRDMVVEGDLPCPVVTVICAINTPYDGTTADRVAGTDKETALDVVSINKATRTIHCTRVGAGSDREMAY